MADPRTVTFSIQVVQTVTNGVPSEVNKLTVGVQPQDENGILKDRIYGIDIPNAADRIMEYVTLFGPAYAQQAVADAQALTVILKRLGELEMAARGMRGNTAPAL
jgi:hypothetical protein